MSIRSPHPRFQLLMLSLPLAGAACFGVEQVDPGPFVEKPEPLVIDDFNDDVDNTVRQPTEPSLFPWRCYGDQPSRVVRCDTGPGPDGSIGRTMDFEFFDVPNGSRDYQSMTLWTESEVPLDFSPYGTIGFSARFHPAPDWEHPYLDVTITLRCTSLGSDVEIVSAVSIALDDAWYDYERSHGTFRQPQWVKDEWQLANRELIDPKACLAQVDGFGIIIGPNLADGAAPVAGQLFVDQIYVE
jgi:hypothetical protein